MEDKFKLLYKNIMQFSQQGDITKARDEYERMISYQIQKVTGNPESFEEKARLGYCFALITEIDKQLAVDKKLVLLRDGINLLEYIRSNSDDNMEPKHLLVFFGLLGTRGRILYDNKNFDSAMEDINEAIKLSRKLKGNFNPSGKGHLARLFVLRSTILYKNNRDHMTANTFPKDVANTCLKDVNEAISILEIMKKSSPEVFNAETGCSDSSFPALLPKWNKLRDGLKSYI